MFALVTIWAYRNAFWDCSISNKSMLQCICCWLFGTAYSSGGHQLWL